MTLATKGNTKITHGGNKICNYTVLCSLMSPVINDENHGAEQWTLFLHQSLTPANTWKERRRGNSNDMFGPNCSAACGSGPYQYYALIPIHYFTTIIKYFSLWNYNPITLPPLPVKMIKNIGEVRPLRLLNWVWMTKVAWQDRSGSSRQMAAGYCDDCDIFIFWGGQLMPLLNTQ